LRFDQLYASIVSYAIQLTNEISSSEAQKIIREIISNGTVIFTNHAKKMIERGYSTHDVEFILQNGIIVKKEFKNKTQTWS